MFRTGFLLSHCRYMKEIERMFRLCRWNWSPFADLFLHDRFGATEAASLLLALNASADATREALGSGRQRHEKLGYRISRRYLGKICYM